MDGILNINKHRGPTSFNVVSVVRRVTGIRKVGHAGTLDPAASGVLPVCLGRAARVSEYLMEYPKTYRTEIEFGKTTDTYDGEGQVTSECTPPALSHDELASVLASFTGDIRQKPPAYSALKVQGKPMYELARSGQEFDIKSRPVTVYNIEILGLEMPVVTLDVECSRGTYIRSLAHDIGQQVGCGAYMKSLVRREYGPFGIDRAVSLDDFKQAVLENDWQKYLYPVDTALKHLKAVVVTDDTLAAGIKNGSSLKADEIAVIQESVVSVPHQVPSDNRYRVYDSSGAFLAVYTLNPETGIYFPEKVFM